jgi:cyclic pyranopterin phosphate synthase
VTVSLDALDESAFRSMSDAPVSLASVLAGIEAADSAGLRPVKVNAVVRRGVNDHCVLALADHFRHRREILRFIEYMDVGSANGWQPAEVVPGAELIAAIGARWPLEALAPTRAGEVARRYRYRDGAGEIGFIQSVTEPFCTGCTRARLSAEGKLYTCLFATRGVDLRALLRAGIGDGALEDRLRAVWGERSDRYSAERASRAQRPISPQPPGGSGRADHGARRIEMSYIGG